MAIITQNPGQDAVESTEVIELFPGAENRQEQLGRLGHAVIGLGESALTIPAAWVIAETLSDQNMHPGQKGFYAIVMGTTALSLAARARDHFSVWRDR